MIEVIAPGPFATIQDRGRMGLGALGVGRSGAADPGAFALGNRLVGNPPDAAAIETTLGGLIVRAGARATVAVTGASTSVHVDDVAAETDRALPLTAGATLRLGAPEVGLRSYVAIRGGVAVPAVLGSRSRDTLAGLGPAPLVAGDMLPVGLDPGTPVPAADVVPGSPVPVGAATLPIWPGPRSPVDSFAALLRVVYAVSADSDRVGVRLDRPSASDAPMPGGAVAAPGRSEGAVTGAVQLTPSGRPIVFLADHPTTGGYPVIAVVAAAAIGAAAQLRPGQRLRFTRAR